MALRRGSAQSNATPVASGSRPTVTVVVCAFDSRRWDLLESAVRSVQHQTEAPAETIVVIDHNPQLLDRARRALPEVSRGRPIRVVDSDRASGLSGARNSGSARAQGDVVAFIDDDAEADPGWVAALADVYSDPAVVAVGGKVEPRWEGVRPEWFPPEFDWVVGCTHTGVRQDSGRVRNVIGANMSFRREVLAELGGFRTDLGRIGSVPLGCEETDACIRASRRPAGGEVVYEPGARVRHFVPASRQSRRYFLRRCYGEGLSKAVVAQTLGSSEALSEERRYLRWVLPAALLAAVGELVHARFSRAARGGAIVSGAFVAAIGYLIGMVRGRLQPQRLRRREEQLRIALPVGARNVDV